MDSTKQTFGDLIAPVSVETFFAEHWERTFLHLHGEADRFARYFSSRDIDAWLTSVRSGLPDSIILTAPEGAATQTERFRPREIDVDTIYASLAGGSSLILNHMEDWPPLLGLVKSLGRLFHADIGVNAYLTPKRASTFATHTDEHDVLILHLEGEKLWRLHEFAILQLGIPQKKNLTFPPEWYGRNRTPLLAEICLKPGDVLFIPRGMPHCAVAKDSATLHLTVSITTLCWMDFLKIAAEAAALRSQVVRRALPPGFVGDEATCEAMRGTFHEVMRAFQESVSFDEVLAAVKRNRVKFQSFPADGHFGEILELDRLGADAELERRPDVLCVVDEAFDNDRKPMSAIWFGSHEVLGPVRLRRALEFVRDNQRFRISDIPGLDEKGQLVLARRLVTEGLLRQVHAGVRQEIAEAAVR